MASKEVFKVAYAAVRKWEGGLSDHPRDPGGLTKWGITLRTLIRKGLDFNNDGVVNRKDLLEMTEEQAEKIYLWEYWYRAKCDHLPDRVAIIHFDAAVNQGVGRAARFLQKAAGARQDGIIGPKTLEAVRKADERKLILEYAVSRALHYSSLAIFATFGRGWLRRLFSIYSTALEFRNQ